MYTNKIISKATWIYVNKKVHTKVKEEKLIDKTLTTTKVNYEIKVVDIFNGTTEITNTTPLWGLSWNLCK